MLSVYYGLSACFVPLSGYYDKPQLDPAHPIAWPI
ncbi:protein of unknown function [Methylorubrum extorquens]|uniref:Uncharacterized protein n=1 Tax=Methylorubrum extorquens TaxID=408 RepID=A0A2N9AM36_METEX|nr:protein of unknown function [Methylorubrum extorquens]